jgi:hypothetical protein
LCFSGLENSRSFASLRMTIQYVGPVIFMDSGAAQGHDISAQDDTFAGWTYNAFSNSCARGGAAIRHISCADCIISAYLAMAREV